MPDAADEPFLRAILADPGDEAVRFVYADWLDDRGDHARAAILRGDETNANGVDAGWRAFVRHLGQPFETENFWRYDFEGPTDPPYRPFTEAVGRRGSVTTFESALRGETTDLSGLGDDIAFLTSLELGECYYGAGSNDLRPFLTELPDDRPLTGAIVLAALKVHRFRSQHIADLDAIDILAPGYQPGTLNDEVHTDPDRQYLFDRYSAGEREGEEDEHSDRSRQLHAALRSRVTNGKLWYVLLHTWDTHDPKEPTSDPDEKGGNVVLFSVGRSLLGRRLVGVVSCQTCHNLCD